MPTLSPIAEAGERCGSVIDLSVGRHHASEGATSPDQDDTENLPAALIREQRSSTGAASTFDLTDAYDAHAGELFGFAVNALRDRSAAEECVQEAFLRAWRARARYDSSRSTVRTWLFAILRNLVRDRHRSTARSPLTVATDEAAEAPAEHQDPTERLAVLEALATLSREHRQAVVAIHLIGASYTELSESTATPVATLRTRTFYALRALRRHFEEGGVRDA